MNFGVANYHRKLTRQFSMLTYNVQKEFSYIFGIKIRFCFQKDPAIFPCLEPLSEVLTSESYLSAILIVF